MSDGASNPAAQHSYDPRWPVRAAEALATIRARIADLPGSSDAALDHIGSTAVPDLAAKPHLDLQLRILPLPTDDQLDARIGDLGYRRAMGARPDSPGVHRDLPRGPEVADERVWEKSVFVQETERIILHVRRADSPWGLFTVRFRDWLRAHPAQRRRYQQVKETLSGVGLGAADYDDYTRAKTAYFDEVQDQFEQWARRER